LPYHIAHVCCVVDEITDIYYDYYSICYCNGIEKNMVGQAK